MFRTMIAGGVALILTAGAAGTAWAGSYEHRKEHGAQVFVGILNGLAAAVGASNAHAKEAKADDIGTYGRARPSNPRVRAFGRANRSGRRRLAASPPCSASWKGNSEQSISSRLKVTSSPGATNPRGPGS